MPKISILTPCYNVKAEWLSQCLDSLKNQTLRDVEFICIDDGSTDDTGKRLDAYAAADARFTVIHKLNTGYGDSMNRALAVSKGKYIGIVEPDDWVELDMFEQLYKVAELQSLDIVRCCHYESRLGAAEIAVTDDWVPKNVVLSPLKDQCVFWQSPGICISLVRKDMITENAIGFLPTPGASFQDMSYGVKMKLCARRYMVIDKILHHYRISDSSSVSQVGTPEKAFCVCKEWDEVFDYVSSRSEWRTVMKPILPTIEASCYSWNMERLTPKMRYDFVKRWQQELLDRIDRDEIDLALVAADSREQLSHIAYGADEWYRQQYGELPQAAKTRGTAPLVSVIVSMYKNERTIEATVRSVLTQSYRNIEVICVDDRSPDNSLAVVSRINDSRLKIVRRDSNGGLSAVRNSGLEVATGDCVMFVDGDDELLPGGIAALVARFDSDVAAVFSTPLIEYEGGAEKYGNYYESDKTYYALPATDMHVIARHEIFRYHVSAWAKLFRMSFVRQAGLKFPEGLLFEDALFHWCYFTLYRERVAFVADPVYKYRRNQASIMSSLLRKPENWAVQDLRIVRKYVEFLDQRSLLTEYERFLPLLIESIFWFSFNQCAEWEKPFAVAQVAQLLHEFKLDVRGNTVLLRIYLGDVNFLFGGVEVEAVKRQLAEVSAQASYWQSETRRLETSNSYNIGRAMTWPWRMTKSSARSLRQDGLRMTLMRVPGKIRNLYRRFFT